MVSDHDAENQRINLHEIKGVECEPSDDREEKEGERGVDHQHTVFRIQL